MQRRVTAVTCVGGIELPLIRTALIGTAVKFVAHAGARHW
jgi:hypothetical protein